MIQKRIAKVTDKHIQKTQFGSRANKSTSQALFIARRIQDLAEESGQNIILTFLDWEKAFDKVDQKRLIEALSRLNFPEKC